jgi:hypothetical protein
MNRQEDHTDAPDQQGIEQDLWTVVGGNFTSDGLGPKRYAATRRRVEAQPDLYLDALERLMLGSNFDWERHAGLRVPTLLKLTARSAPARTATIAKELVTEYTAALEQAPHDEVVRTAKPFASGADEQANRAQRLRARLGDVQSEVLGGLDV